MDSKLFLVGLFIIASTTGASRDKWKDYVPENVGPNNSIKDQAEENVKDKLSNFVYQSPGQPHILLNQKSSVPNQPLIFNQPPNQQAILVASADNQKPLLVYQNPNQQTNYQTNQPKLVLVSQAPNQQQQQQQPIMISAPPNQQGNQPPQLLYVQQPNQEPQIWYVTQPNQQPSQVLAKQQQQPNNKQLSPPVIFLSQPNQQQIMASQQLFNAQGIKNQPSSKPTKVIPQPNQQPLFISSQPKKQPVQQVVNQPPNKPVLDDQNNQIWAIYNIQDISSQQNQPAIFVSQQTNQPTLEQNGQSGQPTLVNVGQPAYVTSSYQPVFGANPNQGNAFIFPINKNY